MTRKRRTSGWHLLLCAVSLCACAAQPARSDRRVPAPPAEPATVREDSTLGVGDVFDIRVFGENDLTAKYRVGGDGTIDFPLVGTIKVAGLLPSQVVSLLRERLQQGILRSPQISIYVQEQSSKKIYILGQVTKPGTFPYTPGMNIVEAITQAGGFTPLSSKNGTTVTRIESGKKLIFHVPAGDISDGIAGNFYVRPGDIVSVPERFF